MDVSDLSDGEEVLVMTRRRVQKQATNQTGLAEDSEPARRSVSSAHSRSSNATERPPTTLSSPFAEDSRAGSAVTYGERQLREFMGWGASANFTPSPSRAATGRGRAMHPSEEARLDARSASSERRAWDSSTTAKVVRPGIMMRPWQKRNGSGGGSNIRASESNDSETSTTNIWSPPPTSSPSPHSKVTRGRQHGPTHFGASEEPGATVESSRFRSMSPTRARSPSPPRHLVNRPTTARGSVDRELPGLVPRRSNDNTSSQSHDHRVEWALPEGRPTPRPRPHSSGTQTSQRVHSASAVPTTTAATSFDLFNQERARLQSTFEDTSRAKKYVDEGNCNSSSHESHDLRHFEMVAQDRLRLHLLLFVTGE